MFSPTILIVIVLYKNKIANSVSYQIIKEQCNSNCKIFIYDNSPVIDSDFIKYPIVYIHDHSNGGLGKAYNSAAQYAKENGIDWLLILDQDTKLLSGFLENYIQTIKNILKFQYLLHKLNYLTVHYYLHIVGSEN